MNVKAKGDLSLTLTPPQKPTRNWPLRSKLSLLLLIPIYYYFFASIKHQNHHLPPTASHLQFIGKQKLHGKEAEKLFLSIPNEKSALAASRAYTAKPHLAGSQYDLDSAIVQLRLLQSSFSIPSSSPLPIYDAGSSSSRSATLSISSPNLSSPNAWIDTYYPVLNTPLERAVEILDEDGQVVWRADLEEVEDEEDEGSKWAREVPAFHGLSAEGDVTGPVIDVNYGSKSDFDALLEAGVNFTGTIALARYGGPFRGLKVEAAQNVGCAGILIYSDPRDDGSVTVEDGYKPYPHGPARNPTTVQRGSVQFLSLYPGDPTTPNYPSYPNATRLFPHNIPRIPSIPISWANAERILEEIDEVPFVEKLRTGNGRVVGWGGRSGRRKVRVMNKVDTKVTPIWNTMGVIPGYIKDEVVLLGNHRDAWVTGAADPTSGTVSTHEVIKAFGELLKSGWKPLRTIVLASWDAEEYGLIGSTEWVEDFPEWIQEHVVAYLNLDVSVKGSRFSLKASPSLSHLLRTAAQDIPHPTDPERTLWDARSDKGKFFGVGKDAPKQKDEEKKKDGEKKVVKAEIGPLGSGSDYTAFLQRLGVASTDEGFGSTLSDPVYHYHSIYDTQRFQEVYADPGFHRNVAVSKHLGLVALRLADSIVLPINTTAYTVELGSYLDYAEKIAAALSLKADFSNLRTAIHKLHRASLKLDHQKNKAERELRKALKKLKKHHKRQSWLRRVWWKVRSWIKRVYGVRDGEESEEGRKWRLSKPKRERNGHCRGSGSGRKHLPPKFVKAIKDVQRVNKKLSSFERGFISEEGIKGREWYKHLGVAPGKWLGYGATTLPGMTEALQLDKNVTLAEYESERLTDLINKLSHSLLQK